MKKTKTKMKLEATNVGVPAPQNPAPTPGLLPRSPKVGDLIWSRAFDLIVLQGDCRLWLDYIPRHMIALTITDPPYESLERHRANGTTTRLKESTKSSNKWFPTFPNRDFFFLFQALYLMHKPNSHCYVFCDSETEHVILSGRNPYDHKSDKELLEIGLRADRTLQHHAPPADCGWRAWPPLTWVKTIKTSKAETFDEPQQAEVRTGMGYHWRRSEERILFLEKGARKLNDLSLKNVLLGPIAGRKDYPTAKPLNIIRALVQNSGNPDPSNSGGIVLDPFAGSGVVALAAKEFRMPCILIDVDIGWIEEHIIPQFDPKGVHIFRLEDMP